MHRRVASLRRCAGLLVAGVVALAPAAGAALDPSSAYAIVAQADAFAVEYVNTAAPVFADNAIVYGTPATARSLVDSVGQSTAFAGGPYPGDILVGSPENARGLAQPYGVPPEAVPSYPFFVQSQHPIKPDASQDQGGNELRAHSEQFSSRSDARSGAIPGDLVAASQAQASSGAAVDPVTGALTGVADSRLDVIKFGDALQIGKSSAHARIVKEPGRPAVKESAFTVGSVVLHGVEIGYSDGGLHAGDESTSGPALPSGVLESLQQAGFAVEVLPATGTETSVESAGLKISQVQTVGAAKQRISVILGRVRIRIDGSAAPAADGLLGGVPDRGAPASPQLAAADPVPTGLGDAPGGSDLGSTAPPFLAAAKLPLTDELDPDRATAPVLGPAGSDATHPTLRPRNPLEGLPSARLTGPAPAAIGWRYRITGPYAALVLVGVLIALGPVLRFPGR